MICSIRLFAFYLYRNIWILICISNYECHVVFSKGQIANGFIDQIENQNEILLIEMWMGEYILQSIVIIARCKNKEEGK